MLRPPAPCAQLRARPADVKDLAAHYLDVHRTRTTGGESLLLGAPALRWVPAAVGRAAASACMPWRATDPGPFHGCRQLLCYQYPVNLLELQTIVDRVAIQALAAAGKETAAATDARPALAAAAAAPAAAAPARAAPAREGGCGRGCDAAGGSGARPSNCPGLCASDSEHGEGKHGASCGCGGEPAVAAAAAAQGECAASWDAESAPATALATGGCEDVELCSSEFWFVTEVGPTWFLEGRVLNRGRSVAEVEVQPCWAAAREGSSHCRRPVLRLRRRRTGSASTCWTSSPCCGRRSRVAASRRASTPTSRRCAAPPASRCTSTRRCHGHLRPPACCCTAPAAVCLPAAAGSALPGWVVGGDRGLPAGLGSRHWRQQRLPASRAATPLPNPLPLRAWRAGPQDRAHSVGLNLVWSYWWPGIFRERGGPEPVVACRMLCRPSGGQKSPLALLPC